MQALQRDERALVVDVRDREQTTTTGLIPGARNVSLGTLPLRADQEVPAALRAPELADRARPIITTCAVGAHAALGAWLLHEMGFADVRFLCGRRPVAVPGAKRKPWVGLLQRLLVTVLAAWMILVASRALAIVRFDEESRLPTSPR